MFLLTALFRLPGDHGVGDHGVGSSDLLEAKTQELVTYFLFRSKAGFGNKRLHQDSADISIFVFSEAKHAIWTSIKVFVVRFDTFKERGEIVVGITEIVQFDDFRTISR